MLYLGLPKEALVGVDVDGQLGSEVVPGLRELLVDFGVYV